MQISRGFTLVEVLTVVAIVAVLGGIVFSMSSGPREKGREAVCSSNLHQIYTALMLYANDNPGPEQVPGLGDIKLMPDVPILLQYTKSHDIFYCPNSTQAMKKAWSTYEIAFQLVDATNNSQVQSYLNQYAAELKNLGNAFPLAICNIHDETYYSLIEPDVDPDLVRPFQIHLQLDGSVKAGRFPGRRHRSFSNQ